MTPKTLEKFVATAKAALAGIDEAWLRAVAEPMVFAEKAKLSTDEVLELLATEIPESYLKACAGESVPADGWLTLFKTLAAKKPTFGEKEAKSLDALWKRANEEFEQVYERALALRLVLSDDASKQRFIELALRHGRAHTSLARQYFDCLALLGDDGSRIEKLLLSKAIGSSDSIDQGLVEGALGSLAAYAAGKARVPAILEKLGKRGVDLPLVARAEEVVAAAPKVMWTALFEAPPEYEWDPGATLVLLLLVADPNLVARLGERTDAELDALVAFPISPYDKPKLREARTNLAKALTEITQSRSIRWSKKGSAHVAKLGVGAKKGKSRETGKPHEKPAARVRLPAIPAEVDAALDLLGERGIRLPKPGKTEAPRTLPAPLRALYARVGKSPTDQSWLSSVSGLAALKRRFDATLNEAEREDDLGENLKRALFSATPALLPFGTSDNGGYYFLDPKKHGPLVFELAHDETELRADATSLATFVAVRMLEEWAEENALDEDLARFREKDEKAAKKASKTKAS